MIDSENSADVAELVDALDLGSSVSRRKSSSLFIRINLYLKALGYP